MAADDTNKPYNVYYDGVVYGDIDPNVTAAELEEIMRKRKQQKFGNPEKKPTIAAQRPESTVGLPRYDPATDPQRHGPAVASQRTEPAVSFQRSYPASDPQRHGPAAASQRQQSATTPISDREKPYELEQIMLNRRENANNNNINANTNNNKNINNKMIAYNNNSNNNNPNNRNDMNNYPNYNSNNNNPTFTYNNNTNNMNTNNRNKMNNYYPPPPPPPPPPSPYSYPNPNYPYNNQYNNYPPYNNYNYPNYNYNNNYNRISNNSNNNNNNDTRQIRVKRKHMTPLNSRTIEIQCDRSAEDLLNITTGKGRRRISKRVSIPGIREEIPILDSFDQHTQANLSDDDYDHHQDHVQNQEQQTTASAGGGTKRGGATIPKSSIPNKDCPLSDRKCKENCFCATCDIPSDGEDDEDDDLAGSELSRFSTHLRDSLDLVKQKRAPSFARASVKVKTMVYLRATTRRCHSECKLKKSTSDTGSTETCPCECEADPPKDCVKDSDYRESFK